MRNNATTTERETSALENPQKNELTHKQALFVNAYVTMPTLLDACKAAGITDETGRRYLTFPHVQASYQSLRKAYFDQSLALLISFSKRAITTLVKHMSDEKTPPGVQVRAAQIVLEQGINIHRLNELEARIAELEREE